MALLSERQKINMPGVFVLPFNQKCLPIDRVESKGEGQPPKSKYLICPWTLLYMQRIHSFDRSQSWQVAKVTQTAFDVSRACAVLTSTRLLRNLYTVLSS